MNIEEIIKYLKDKSRIDIHGMGGTEVYVEKKYLSEAAVYLEDYLYILDEQSL
jgi:hypothetical protein